MSKMIFLILIQVSVLFLAGCITPDFSNLVNNSVQNGTIQNNSVVNNDSGIEFGDNTSIVLTSVPRRYCTDSDSGEDYYEKGTTRNTTLQLTDACVASILWERYCKTDKSIGLEMYTCPNGCTNGECKIEIEPYPPVGTTCIDNDDGKDYYEKGTTVSTSASGRTVLTDACVVGILWERYCKSDDSIGLETYTCPNGCTNGECNSASAVICVDSDDDDSGPVDPDSYYETGTTTLTSSPASHDWCNPTTHKITEYYCPTLSTRDSTTYTCPYGCDAINDRCNPAPLTTTCSDTDGGSNVNVKGTATKGTLVYTDTCSGNNILEYYCEDGDLYELTQSCTYGCNNGECNPTTAPTITCNDSDDSTSGSVSSATYNVKGSTTLTDQSTKYDSCNAATGEITEWYCPTSSTRSSVTYDCPNGCFVANDYCNAAPSTPTCTDSDGGLNYNVKGTTTLLGTDTTGATPLTQTDSCNQVTGMVTEWFCPTSTTRNSNTHTCPNGCLAINDYCNAAPSPDINTEPVVYFDSPTGQRQVLIINDLPSYIASGNEMNAIVSVGIGQDTTYEVLEERDSYNPVSEYPQIIDYSVAYRNMDPTILVPEDGYLGSRLPYRYFTIPDTYTLPYNIDIYYGRWDPNNYRFVKMFSYVDDCSGTEVVKKAAYLNVNDHPAGKVVAIKLSAFVPEYNLYDSEFCE
ncbi:MAG: hypothetical protein ABID61_06110 [Candidatus Micrarchaeota archaeon]